MCNMDKRIDPFYETGEDITGECYAPPTMDGKISIIGEDSAALQVLQGYAECCPAGELLESAYV